jgi:hypothetical protein
MNDGPSRDGRAASVETYKRILRNLLDQRPSGTRQRLATALGKNRSFVTQISNPAYSVPIPAPHLEIIFEICRFSPLDKSAFLEAFTRAHPNRDLQIRNGPNLRSLRLEVFDFGNVETNREFDELVRETARRLSRLMRRDGQGSQ